MKAKSFEEFWDKVGGWVGTSWSWVWPGVLQGSLEDRRGQRWAGPAQEHLKEQNVPKSQPCSSLSGTPETSWLNCRIPGNTWAIKTKKVQMKKKMQLVFCLSIGMSISWWPRAGPWCHENADGKWISHHVQDRAWCSLLVQSLQGHRASLTLQMEIHLLPKIPSPECLTPAIITFQNLRRKHKPLPIYGSKTLLDLFVCH